MEQPITVQCPFCGETFVTFADPSVASQTYIEDCQVCCRPIQMRLEMGDDGDVCIETDRSQ